MVHEHAPARGQHGRRSLPGLLAVRLRPAALLERLEILAGRLMLGAAVLTLGGAVVVGALVPHLGAGPAPAARRAARRRRRVQRRALDGGRAIPEPGRGSSPAR